MIFNAHRAWEVIRWQALFDGLQSNRLPDSMCCLSVTYKIMSSLKKGLAVGVRDEGGLIIFVDEKMS